MMGLPDVIGWELSRAREECRALGVDVTIKVTHPPAKQTIDLQAGADEDTLRVVAVRPAGVDAALLIVCPEIW